MSLTTARGNLFDSDCQTLTNPVNCTGVMGKGIAKQFRKLSKQAFEDYRERCKAKSVVPGIVYVHPLGNGRQILHFPTKRHWRSRSRVEDIRAGLENLRERFELLGIESLALPAIGCGEGGLDWETQVSPLVSELLGDLPIPVEVYIGPGGGESWNSDVRQQYELFEENE